MVVFVGALKWVLPSTWPLYLRFSLEVVTGAIVYVLALAIFHAERVRTFKYLMLRMRS